MTIKFDRNFRVAPNSNLICEGDRINGADFNARVGDHIAGLRRIGVNSGDRVVLHGKKSIDQAALIFAIINLGATLVPIFQGLKDEQVAHIVLDCAATLIVTTGTSPQSIRDIASDANIPCMKGEALEAYSGSELMPAPSSGGTKLNSAAIIYTSGSTGLPKGICLSHENLMLSAMSVASYMRLTPKDNVMCVLPFSFDAGLNQLLAAAIAGASVVLCDFLMAPLFARICIAHRVTVITGVPGLWSKVVDHNWSEEANAVRLIANTGGKLYVNIQSDLQRTFPDADIMPMYGFTEAFRCSFLQPKLLASKPNSVGQPIPFSHYAILNAEGGLCQAGEVGELFQFGRLVSQGYWQRADSNANKFPANPPEILREFAARMARDASTRPEYFMRFVRSGDLMKIDKDGDLYFVARADDMIKVNGFRISPTEIEDALFRLGIKDAIAVSKSTENGDLIGVACRSEELSALSVDAIQGELKSRLPSYMVPSVISVLESFPITQNGKFDRKQIQAQLFANIGETP